MATKRIKTGIDGLDNLIEGGFPEGSLILISGSPGTGKTIFGLQYLYQGAKINEHGIYVTFHESKESLLKCGEIFGWDIKDLEREGKIVIQEYFGIESDLYQDELERLKNAIRELEKSKETVIKKGGGIIGDIDMKVDVLKGRVKEIEDIIAEERYTLSQKERDLMFLKKLKYIADEIHAKRLVIDSLSGYMIHNGNREALHSFIKKIAELGTTTLLISELPEETSQKSIEKISEYLVDGVITLTLEETLDMRKIRVKKMRQTKHTLKPQTIEISDKGIRFKK